MRSLHNHSVAPGRIASRISLLLVLALPAEAQGIFNGDFELGNVGFGTTYAYSPVSNTGAGEYDVDRAPNAWHSHFAACTDHTSGAGNMLIVNGSTAGTADRVWGQVVAVQPNTAYTFSFYATSLHSTAPARLRVFLGPVQQPSLLALTSALCQWDQYAVEWHSGTATSVSIVIANSTTAFNGNDFAIDDLSFTPTLGQSYCAPAVPNSTGRSGVCIFGGSLQAAAHDVRLTAASLPLNVSGYFLLSETQGLVPMAGGSVGTLCLGGTIGRLASLVGNSGVLGLVTIDLDTSALPPPLASVIVAGETWNFQFWHRDGASSNFTSAVSVQFN